MSRRRFLTLSVVLDAVLVNAGFVVAYLIRFGGELPRFNFEAYVALAPLLTLAYLAAGYIYGLYEPEHTESSWAVARAVFPAITLGAVLTAAISFFGGPRFFAFSRLAILIAWVLHFAALVGWRALALRLGGISWPEQRILILGTGSVAAELADELRRREAWGYRVVGFARSTPEEDLSEEVAASGLPVLGTAEDVPAIVAEHDAHRVIVVSPVQIRELVEDLALCEETEVRVEVVPELYEVFIGTVDSMVADIPLMEITRRTVAPWYSATKRALDIAGAAVLLIALSPVLLFAALGVALTMGLPVFFAQERVGRDMRRFRVYKFRTMVRGAESASGPVLATSDDDRVTPFGRFLRRYRLDELPQLLNILDGAMSFVGPRPERPFFVERFVREIPGYRERFRVKPGVTGLAQVAGGYATTPERKLKYDLIYMYHQNLPMDLQIVVETLRVVLTGRGAV
ncbi:MAG: sugar transferase [Coriobacteriia bacterium]|nr:sugar transferase [Coriobacteriia bacterium]